MGTKRKVACFLAAMVILFINVGSKRVINPSGVNKKQKEVVALLKIGYYPFNPSKENSESYSISSDTMRISDPRGNKTIFKYDQSGRLYTLISSDTEKQLSNTTILGNCFPIPMEEESQERLITIR